MESFALLMGHLLGDFILQNDWMAKYKGTKHPGPKPEHSEGAGDPNNLEEYRAWLDARNARAVAEDWDGWPQRKKDWDIGHVACLAHCVFYTLGVALCCFWFLALWAYPVIFLTHVLIDRFGLARRWMNHSGLRAFATGALSPWSVVTIDQCFHFMVLFLCGLGSLYA